VKICSEALECFGGAGYIEDTGLPQLLRDAQVYSIWEGTTNVLSLDSLRALADDSFTALRQSIDSWLDGCNDAAVINAIHAALDDAGHFIESQRASRDTLEAGARGLAITLARCTAAALLARQATWSSVRDDARAAAALRRFVAHGLSRLSTQDAADTELLLG
jgi:acyl-CoA dehydrogenase